MKTTFGLFVCERQAWQAETEDKEEQRYEGPWPVAVWLTALDALDGHGWGRSKLERHAEVLSHHLYDVGSGDQTEAVLAKVETEDALVSLQEAGFELWDGTEPPPRL